MEFRKLNDYAKENLFNLITQLYQEPKYYWKLKGANGLIRSAYLHLDKSNGNYYLSTTIHSAYDAKCKFTKVEFNEAREQLGFTLEFEPEEEVQ